MQGRCSDGFGGLQDHRQCRAAREARHQATPIDGRIEPNGAPVAFTGFTLDSLVPLTAQSQLLGYQALNLLLDKAPWPGASGAPAYNIEGRVIGLLVQGMSDIAIARSGRAIKEFLDQR